MDDGRIVGVATERYARKKEAILAAATAVLNRQGVRGMTLADVAARVGLIGAASTKLLPTQGRSGRRLLPARAGAVRRHDRPGRRRA